MKTKQLIFAASALIFSLSASAASWTASYATSPTASATSTELGGFTNTTITVNLSKNVGIAATGSATALVVNTGSTKGKNSYGGGTTGGSVKECADKPVNTTNGYGVAAPSITGDGCS